MIVIFTDEDLTEGAGGVAVEDVTWDDLKGHKRDAALPAESAYFVRGDQSKSLKERSTPNSSLTLSALLARSEAIN